jgi:hypothetical protein
MHISSFVFLIFEEMCRSINSLLMKVYPNVTMLVRCLEVNTNTTVARFAIRTKENQIYNLSIYDWFNASAETDRDCEHVDNHLCNEPEHVVCDRGYYGDHCDRYCNSSMFTNCVCDDEGDLQCSKDPVGVYFELQIKSIHNPYPDKNATVSLFFKQRYATFNLF